MGGYVNTHHEKGATMFGLFHVVSLIWRAEHPTFCLPLSLAPGAEANAHPINRPQLAVQTVWTCKMMGKHSPYSPWCWYIYQQLPQKSSSFVGKYMGMSQNLFVLYLGNKHPLTSYFRIC